MLKRTPPPQPAGEREEGTEGPNGEWVPFRTNWKPSPHTWPPLAESWAQAQQASDLGRLRRDDPAVEAAPKAPEPAPAPPVPAPASPAPSETLVYPRPLFGSTPLPEPVFRPEVSANKSQPDVPPVQERPSRVSGAEAGATEEVSWALRPLAWINSGFETVASCAGSPGRWLAGPGGKTLLGVLGLLCLAGAVGLVVADWLGWTW